MKDWRDWVKPVLTSGALWGLIFEFVGWAIQTYTTLPAPVWAFLYGAGVIILGQWGIVVAKQQVQAVRLARSLQAAATAQAVKDSWKG